MVDFGGRYEINDVIGEHVGGSRRAPQKAPTALFVLSNRVHSISALR